MGKYYCGICDKVSNQKSHHEAHLKSELHITKVENFRLKLEQKSIDEILKEYPEYKTTCSGFTNEDYLIDGETPNDNITAVNTANIKLKFDLIKKIIVSKITYTMNTEPMNEPNKYKPSNKVVWELGENEGDKQYLEEFKKIQSVIDKVHQFMFNTNQINGITAMRDMMKILPFILMKSYF